jgi:pimeloyl-ACP methyl ester carboxylesterase
MPQLVFLHGPGAGGCAEAFRYQLDYFRGSLAPTLPGHGAGVSCASIERYTEWVRGWLWAQGRHHDLVLVGYTLGACIALQYGLDYPEEVSGLVLMTVAMRPKHRAPGSVDMRLRVAEEPVVYAQWIAAMRQSMRFVALSSGSVSSPAITRLGHAPSIMIWW